MDRVTRTADSKGRVTLGRDFANLQLVLEYVTGSEVRIRRAVLIPEDELPYYEETSAPLTDRDRDAFLALLENPPEPSEALRRAAARHAGE